MTCGHHSRRLSCLSLVDRHRMTVLLGDPAPFWRHHHASISRPGLRFALCRAGTPYRESDCWRGASRLTTDRRGHRPASCPNSRRARSPQSQDSARAAVHGPRGPSAPGGKRPADPPLGLREELAHSAPQYSKSAPTIVLGIKDKPDCPAGPPHFDPHPGNRWLR